MAQDCFRDSCPQHRQHKGVILCIGYLRDTIDAKNYTFKTIAFYEPRQSASRNTRIKSLHGGYISMLV